jgi:hypothetical protein
MTDPALDFWLRHVALEGGLYEPAGDATYVVLPPALSNRYRLPEELRVTDDPDVARDEGVTMLATGHPVLSDTAERILAAGDAGTISLSRPTSVPPSADVLLGALRDAVPVDHGKIYADEAPVATAHPVIRIGALVTFELSAEDRFQEQAERWVDAPSRRLLPAGIVERLSRAAVDESAVATAGPDDMLPAIAEAHRLIDAAALARREALTGEVSGAYQAERARAAAYYADAIAGIKRRLATAPEDRKAVLEQRLRSTREEETRRLAEIAEKYAASHTIRPYRLHVVQVPAIRLRADVRRGDRGYPMIFDWLLPAAAFAPVRCPSCGSEAPLVAGKQKLGCETCLPPRADPMPAPPPAKPTPPPAKPAPPPAKPAPSPKPAPPSAKPAPSAKPTPPPAKPATPPRAKQQAKRLSPEKIAERLWTTVAAGLSRDASPLLEPGSPAAVLYEVFGPPGLTQVIGFPPHVSPHKYTAGAWQRGASPNLISGTLIGADESEHRYFLNYRGGLVTEVLPCPVYDDGELWKPYWFGKTGDEAWTGSRIPRGADLDQVGRTILGTGPLWHGLPVAARSVAAWERISDSHDRVLNGREPRVVAAAVDRLVAYRAGGRATFADAAAVYRVPEPTIRQADRAVRPLLGLAPGCPW